MDYKCNHDSIKKKQKLFKTHFLSGEQDKIRKYKLYSKKLNKVKELAKKNYKILLITLKYC